MVLEEFSFNPCLKSSLPTGTTWPLSQGLRVLPRRNTGLPTDAEGSVGLSSAALSQPAGPFISSFSIICSVLCYIICLTKEKSNSVIL